MLKGSHARHRGQRGKLGLLRTRRLVTHLRGRTALRPQRPQGRNSKRRARGGAHPGLGPMHRREQPSRRHTPHGASHVPPLIASRRQEDATRAPPGESPCAPASSVRSPNWQVRARPVRGPGGRLSGRGQSGHINCNRHDSPQWAAHARSAKPRASTARPAEHRWTSAARHSRNVPSHD